MVVFVYGTLMRERSNHSNYLAKSKYLGVGVLKGYGLYDLGPYPAVKPQQDSYVIGELYDIDQTTKERLDYLEGEGSLYIATLVQVRQDDRFIDDVLVYVYNHQVDKSDYVSPSDLPWKGSGLYE